MGIRDVLIPARPEHPASLDLTPVCRVEPPISRLSGLVCRRASTLLPRTEVRGLCLWASQPHERSALRTRSRRRPKAGQSSGVGAKRVSGKHWREAPLLCEGDPDFSHIPPRLRDAPQQDGRAVSQGNVSLEEKGAPDRPTALLLISYHSTKRGRREMRTGTETVPLLPHGGRGGTSDKGTWERVAPGPEEEQCPRGREGTGQRRTGAPTWRESWTGRGGPRRDWGLPAHSVQQLASRDRAPVQESRRMDGSRQEAVEQGGR